MTLSSIDNTTHKVRLLNREIIAENTVALYLEKPEGFKFIPGQNIDLALIDHERIDPEGCSRTFSIASAPHEGHIEVAARLRDNPYKQALGEMPIGSQLIIDGPYGNFRMHDDPETPAVFLIGGVGITPALSMLRHLAHNELDYDITIFYINRNRERAAYYDELAGYQSILPRYRFIPSITRPESSTQKWNGETGYFNIDMLGRYIDDFSKPNYYLVAASQIVWDMVQMISEKTRRDQIRVEDFTGF